MKKNTSNFGKLQLNKNTIVKLNNDQMETVKGGLEAGSCGNVTVNCKGANTNVCTVQTATKAVDVDQ